MESVKINPKILILGIIFSTLLISSSFGFSTSYAATWTVDFQDQGMNNILKIQEIIDNAQAGDTILFNGTSYTHLYGLVINKTLNIISDVGTKLSGCPSNAENPIFTILEGGSGSTISGFNISAKDYGIVIDNASNVNIENNLITATISAITVTDSWNIILNNNIIKNSEIGISINNSSNTKITNSTITNNGYGIKYYGNTNNTEISNNNISYNSGHGIMFDGPIDYMQDNVKILLNYIQNQGKSGIYINSSYINFDIISNMITNNGQNGIYMDTGTNTSGNPNILYNYILYNTGFNDFQIQRVMTDDYTRAVLKIGYNFYGSTSKSGAGLCSKTTTGIILTELKELSKGIYQLSYKTNDTGTIITEMIPHYVKVYLNNNTNYKEVLVKNGTATVDFRESTYNSAGNKVYTYQKYESPLSINDSNIPQKLVSISSKIASSSVKNGQIVKYTINIDNIGEKLIKNINIKDILPNLAISSFNTNIGTFNKNTKVWTINSMSAGQKATLNVNLKTNKAGTYKNTATLTGDGFNKKSDTTTLKVNDYVELKNTNYVGTTKIKKNRYKTVYTVIKNNGTKSSSYINVKITPSSGLKIYSVNNNKYYNKKTKTWKIKVPAKKSVTLKMKVKATKKGSKNVTFNVNGKKQTKSIKVV